MKFLVDAQLRRRLSELLCAQGHESVHTLDLPSANRTTDDEINRVALAEQRAVISKDSDFVDSFLLRRELYKLLVVATGNIRTPTCWTCSARTSTRSWICSLGTTTWN